MASCTSRANASRSIARAALAGATSWEVLKSNVLLSTVRTGKHRTSHATWGTNLMTAVRQKCAVRPLFSDKQKKTFSNRFLGRICFSRFQFKVSSSQKNRRNYEDAFPATEFCSIAFLFAYIKKKIKKKYFFNNRTFKLHTNTYDLKYVSN